jgi:hypothetical protein
MAERLRELPVRLVVAVGRRREPGAVGDEAGRGPVGERDVERRGERGRSVAGHDLDRDDVVTFDERVGDAFVGAGVGRNLGAVDERAQPGVRVGDQPGLLGLLLELQVAAEEDAFDGSVDGFDEITGG